MKNLYGTISINKVIEHKNESTSESINYYKLKNEKYGFEIEKKFGNNEIEKTNVIDVTDDEKKINDILKLLVNKEVLPSYNDVIEDVVKEYT